VIELNPACAAMIEVLAGVADDHLTSPTPCTEYTVGDLIDHVDLVAQGATGLALGSNELADTGYSHLEPDWRDTVAQHVRALGKAWDDPAIWEGTGSVPGSDLSNSTWGKIALTELVVHGWDIVTATGQPFDPPEHTLKACFEHVAAFVPNAPLPDLRGPPVAVPPDATLLDRRSQLGLMRRANLIQARKVGSNVYYSVSDPMLFVLLEVAKRIITASLTETQELLEQMQAPSPNPGRSN
jgi:uncharacterized protein (TIGR03086 family)